MGENGQDVSLLQTDPQTLIVKYQVMIRMIVVRFIGDGMFAPQDLDDVIQSVNAGLLSRIPSIQKNYDGRFLVVTYLSAIIRNICYRLHNSAPPNQEPLGIVDPEGMSPDHVFDELAIGEALNALREVIAEFHKDAPRISILLRLHFKLPLDRQTVLSAFPRCSLRRMRKALEGLGENISLMNEREIYGLGGAFLNMMERNSTSADGYRHWLNERIPQIIRLLQIRLAKPDFTKEALRTLVERWAIQSEDEK